MRERERDRSRCRWERGREGGAGRARERGKKKQPSSYFCPQYSRGMPRACQHDRAEAISAGFITFRGEYSITPLAIMVIKHWDIGKNTQLPILSTHVGAAEQSLDPKPPLSPRSLARSILLPWLPAGCDEATLQQRRRRQSPYFPLRSPYTVMRARSPLPWMAWRTDGRRQWA